MKYPLKRYRRGRQQHLERVAAKIADQAQQIDRKSRIHLLGLEMERRLDASRERTRGIEMKAGTIITGAGIVAGSSALSADDTAARWFAILPILLAAAAVFCAVRALRPLFINVPDGRAIVEKYRDAAAPGAAVEEVLLEVRTTETELREKANDKRIPWVRHGFSILLAAVSSLLVVVIALNFFPPNGDDNGESHPTPTAVEQRQ